MLKEKKILSRPEILTGAFTFCAGCNHGTINKLIAESIESLGLRERVIAVIGVGCCSTMYNFWDTDAIVVPHGRAQAVATGLKRVHPDKIVFTYQGDGDLAGIGMHEAIHTPNRGENITTFFINNGIYGMTGGQGAPTTLLGAKTTTTPLGRVASEGVPIRMCELLETLSAPVFIQRVALFSPAETMKARKAIEKALKCQVEGRGFSFVEFLSNCPTNWKMTPLESLEYVRKMSDYFPLKVFREPQ